MSRHLLQSIFSGSNKEPEFKLSGVPYETSYDLAAGQHTFELRNMANAVFVDGFCLTITPQPQPVQGGTGGGGSTSQGSWTASQSSTMPGQTSSNDSSVNPGQGSSNTISLGSNARAISVAAEASNGIPMRLVLLDPAGLTLQVADAVNGVAVINAPVTTGGLYTIRVVNLSLGPVTVWSVATPSVQR